MASTGIPARPAAHPLRIALERSRRTPVVGLLATSTAAVAVGLLTATAQPRGPVTREQALVVLLSGLFLGVVAAVATRTRVAPILAILAYVASFELGRLDAVGPTVDDIRLDSAVGILAFATGRGFHGLIVVLAILLGASLGGLAMCRLATDDSSAARAGMQGTLRRTVLGLVVAALAVGIALPRSTPPILGPDGRPLAGSIAELTTVRLGGLDQTILVRAADPTRPVLLYLSGGPGQSDLALSRVLSEPWIHEFVFVDWDQRGAGLSYRSFEPVETHTLDRAVADTIELSEYLRTRFDEPKVYLMGESWGTILGVLAVERRPDLYFAWLGSGQMVDVAETDRRIYRDLVAYAKRVGDGGLAAALAAIGEPPYRDTPWSNALVWSWYDYLYGPYTPSHGYLARGEASGLDPFGLLGSEYGLVDKMNVIRGLADTFAVMYPQLQGLDLRRDVTSLGVPVYVLDGAAELEGRRSLALEWFDRLEAPAKQLVTFEGAAHSVAFEQADEVLRLLTREVVPTTYGRP
jgi:pimeloyl-ACP methyl ester carboxylesterase